MMVSVLLKYPWRRADHPPKTYDELLGFIVIDDNSVDEAIIITSADDIIIIDDGTKKDRKPKEKTRCQGWILCFLSEKEEEVPINNTLIGVTTKSWSSLDEMWEHHNTSPFTIMKKWMTT